MPALSAFGMFALKLFFFNCEKKILTTFNKSPEVFNQKFFIKKKSLFFFVVLWPNSLERFPPYFYSCLLSYSKTKPRTMPSQRKVIFVF